MLCHGSHRIPYLSTKPKSGLRCLALCTWVTAKENLAQGSFVLGSMHGQHTNLWYWSLLMREALGHGSTQVFVGVRRLNKIEPLHAASTRHYLLRSGDGNAYSVQ